MQSLASASTEELENALIASVLQMEQAGTLSPALLPVALHLVRLQREVATHKRGGMVLNHEEYTEAQHLEKSVRAELIDLCLTSGVF